MKTKWCVHTSIATLKIGVVSIRDFLSCPFNNAIVHFNTKFVEEMSILGRTPQVCTKNPNGVFLQEVVFSNYCNAASFLLFDSFDIESLSV